MKLQANNLTLEISGTTILKEIDFSIDQSELVMLIGPNGSGKTSLIRALSGDVAVTHGEVLLQGKRLKQWSSADRAKKMALLFQQVNVNFAITVQQLIQLGRHPHPVEKATDQNIIEQVMSCMGLTEMAQRSVLSLSGGEQQRVQIARVLAQVWQLDGRLNGLLILDEPLASLDIDYQYQLLQLLQTLRSKGLSIIVSIHDLNLASIFADRMILLDQGRVVANGSPEQVFTQQNLAKVFHQPVQIVPHPDSSRPQMMFSSAEYNPVI